MARLAEEAKRHEEARKEVLARVARAWEIKRLEVNEAQETLHSRSALELEQARLRGEPSFLATPWADLDETVTAGVEPRIGPRWG